MRSRPNGFTLIELMGTTLLMTVMAAIAVPGAISSYRRYQVGSGVRAVAAEIRSARQRAVAAGRSMRSRFNCPATGQYRMVEVVGNPALDNAQDRCSGTSYPYPDSNGAALPDLDGRVMLLPDGTTFGVLQEFDIDPTGRVTTRTGTPPATIEITDGHDSQTLSVSISGRVTLP